jgi:hypothetical protein
MYRNFTPDSDFAVVPFTPTKPPEPPRRQPWFFGNDDDLQILLERACDLLRTGFAQGHLALDNRANNTDPLTLDAVKFCAIGAIMRINEELPVPRFLGKWYRRQRYNEAVLAIYKEIQWQPGWSPYTDDRKHRAKAVMYWNDGTNRNTVVSGFTRAIDNERTTCLLHLCRTGSTVI